MAKPGQQLEPEHIDCYCECVFQRKRALAWIKTEVPSQQHDKPIYWCCFEKLTGPHTHTHTNFWLSIVPDLFVVMNAYPCCPYTKHGFERTQFQEEFFIHTLMHDGTQWSIIELTPRVKNYYSHCVFFKSIGSKGWLMAYLRKKN